VRRKEPEARLCKVRLPRLNFIGCRAGRSTLVISHQVRTEQQRMDQPCTCVGISKPRFFRPPTHPSTNLRLTFTLPHLEVHDSPPTLQPCLSPSPSRVRASTASLSCPPLIIPHSPHAYGRHTTGAALWTWWFTGGDGTECDLRA
jgi:hypothetical protein